MTSSSRSRATVGTDHRQLSGSVSCLPVGSAKEPQPAGGSLSAMLTPGQVSVERRDAELAIRLLACFEGILRSDVLDDGWLSPLRVGAAAPLSDAHAGEAVAAAVAIIDGLIERLRVAEERAR